MDDDSEDTPEIVSISELNKIIAEFLANHCQSTGGWAKVIPADIEKLRHIVWMLIRLKCDADPDGDYPIEFKIIDRTQDECFNFVTVPYSDKDEAGHIDAVLINAGIANRAASAAWDHLMQKRLDQRQRQQKRQLAIEKAAAPTAVGEGNRT